MVKNNIKSIFLYLLVQIASIIFLSRYSSNYAPASYVFNHSFTTFVFSSFLYIILGFFLKPREDASFNFKSVLAIGLISTLSLFIVALGYNDYVIPDFEQSTPGPSSTLYNLISTIQIFNTSEYWIIGLPYFKHVNRFLIVLGGLHSTVMFFIGMQLKKYTS